MMQIVTVFRPISGINTDDTPSVLARYQVLISLRLRTNYVIRVMRIKDKGGRKKFKYYK
jgi:hypothetical protein